MKGPNKTVIPNVPLFLFYFIQKAIKYNHLAQNKAREYTAREKETKTVQSPYFTSLFCKKIKAITKRE